jgi:hypothetical protein
VNPILVKLGLTVGIETLKYFRRKYELLTPEEKEQIRLEGMKPPDEQWWNKVKGDGG